MSSSELAESTFRQEIIEWNKNSSLPVINIFDIEPHIKYGNYTDAERSLALFYISKIIKVDPKKGQDYQEKYSQIIENATSDLQTQTDAIDKLNELIKDLRRYYKEIIYEPQIVNMIDYIIEHYKKDASKITLDEMMKMLHKYRMYILNDVQNSANRDEVFIIFAELQAICLAIYYKYHKSKEHQEQFEEIKPDGNTEAINLIKFLSSLEIEDSYFQYRINSIDIESISKNLELFYDDKLWDIVADYYDILEYVKGEVDSKSEDNRLAEGPNKKYSLLMHIIQGIIQAVTQVMAPNRINSSNNSQNHLTIKGNTSRENKYKISTIPENETESDGEESIYESWEFTRARYFKDGHANFLKNLMYNYSTGEQIHINFSKEICENLEKRLTHFEKRIINDDKNLFKIETEEDVWTVLYAIVLLKDKDNSGKVDGFYTKGHYGENGRFRCCVEIKGEPRFVSESEISQSISYTMEGETTNIELFTSITDDGTLDEKMERFKRILSRVFNIHLLNLLSEIDVLFGVYCTSDYINALMDSIDRCDNIENNRINIGSMIIVPQFHQNIDNVEWRLKDFFPGIEISNQMALKINRDKHYGRLAELKGNDDWRSRLKVQENPIEGNRVESNWTFHDSSIDAYPCDDNVIR